MTVSPGGTARRIAWIDFVRRRATGSLTYVPS